VITVPSAYSDVFVIAENPNAGISLPYLLSLPVADEEWPDTPQVVDEFPLVGE